MLKIYLKYNNLSWELRIRNKSDAGDTVYATCLGLKISGNSAEDYTVSRNQSNCAAYKVHIFIISDTFRTVNLVFFLTVYHLLFLRWLLPTSKHCFHRRLLIQTLVFRMKGGRGVCSGYSV